MPPIGRVDITAADAVGSAPITSIELPDDGGKPLAADWQNVAAMALANAFGAGYPVRSSYSEVVTSSPWAIASTNTVSGNTWTSTSVTLDVADCAVDDVIEVHAHGHWQLNASDAPGDVVGRAKLLFTEDVSGTPSAIATVYSQATITDDGASLTLPHNEPWTLTARHTIVAAGTTRITVQARSQDLTGGAGLGTVVFMFSARMDVTHLRKS
jgi:hypothetical protein